MLISETSINTSAKNHSPSQILMSHCKGSQKSAEKTKITIELKNLPFVRSFIDQDSWVPQYMLEAQKIKKRHKEANKRRLNLKQELINMVNDDLMGYFRNKVAEKKANQRCPSSILSNINWYSSESIPLNKEEAIKIRSIQADRFDPNEERPRATSFQDQQRLKQDPFFTKRRLKYCRANRTRHLEKEAKIQKSSSIDVLYRRSPQKKGSIAKGGILQLNCSQERGLYFKSKKDLNNSKSSKYFRKLSQKNYRIQPKFGRTLSRKVMLKNIKTLKNAKN
ncbi:unnamed protein product [Moneuplotes crassus]|uniref:Uncharacterized protein n=1 Tax=Euplotes crassus TaxID=5936 RepID=A0AAD1XAR4_EUPCR|nr:unnamed protein product [Moneuplotes crassus]